MDLKKMYEENENFHRYVDRYAKEFDLTTREALDHSVVRNAAEYYQDAEKGKISVSEIKVGCGCVGLEDKSC